MAAKNYEEWVPFLNDVAAFWEENGLPETEKVLIGGVEMNLADVVAMRDGFASYDSRIKKVERELETLQDSRLADATIIGKFGVDFRSAVVGRFGAASQAARNCPVVTKRRASEGRAAGTEVKSV